jgi:hypothetical protein
VGSILVLHHRGGDKVMTREEFFNWLDDCPTHKWEITCDEYGYVIVSFPTIEKEEEDC